MGIAAMMSSLVPVGASIGIMGVVLLVAVFRMRRKIKKLEAENEGMAEQKKQLDERLLELELSKTAAETSNQTKTKFMANMSHEIRTPINTILGMDEMILRESGSETVTEYAENIKNAGRMLLSLLDDILDYAKIEMGHLNIEKEAYDLQLLIREVIEMVTPLAEGKNLETKLIVDENTPCMVEGDANRLLQVLVNVLTNAVKYTPIGSLTFSVGYNWETNDEVELHFAVSDTGIGIREEDIPKLFDSFARMESKQSQDVEGTGLGLAISKEILAGMNTEMKVKSEYGQGSVFSFSLVQKKCGDKKIGSKQSILHTEEEIQGGDDRRFLAPSANLLAVDDNKMNLAVVRGLLKRNHIQIDTAESGEECLAMVQKKQYHIILMDYVMPQMNGAQTLSILKKMEGNLSKDAPVIVLTANAMEDEKEQYLKEGFTDYLSKPLQSSALEDMLGKYLPADLLVPVDSYVVEIAEDVMSIKQDIDREQETEGGTSEKEYVSFGECCERIKEVEECLLNFELELAMEKLKNLAACPMEENTKQGIGRALTQMKQENYEQVAEILKDIRE